jgi:hypothetical protein
MNEDKWQKYAIKADDYLRLTNHYELRLELWDGVITCKTGNPVVWLERNDAVHPRPACPHNHL